MSEQLTAGRRGFFISLGMSLAALVVVLIFTVDEHTISSMLQLYPGYLAAAFFMVVLLWLVEGLRIKVLAWMLDCRQPLPWRQAVSVFLVSFFFSGVTPLAVGEMPALVYGLTRRGISAGKAAAVALVRAFLTKCTSVLSAAFLLFMGGRFVTAGMPYFRFFRGVFWLAGVSLLLYLLLICCAGPVVVALNRLFDLPCLQKLCCRKPKVKKWFDGFCAEAGRFRETVAHINRRRLPLVLLPFFLTVLYWGLYYSIAPVLLAGFGVRAPFGTAVMWQILIILVLPYIPVPGGSGAVEFGLATLFSSFVPASVLGVFIVAWRFFTYYLTLICGAVLAFRFKR